MRTAKNKILVVEDESIVAAHIAESLKHSGYKVTDTVSLGEQAVESVMQNRPDLVLMDIVLKGQMDGVETGEVIYSNFDIPIIFLTAYADKRTLKGAKRVQPFGYLVKPFKEEDLHSSIQMGLEKHRQEKGLKERERWLSSSLKNIGEPVIATDIEAKVTFFNRAAETLTGLDETNVLGTSIDNIWSQNNDIEAGENPFVTVLKTGKSSFFSDCLVRGREKKVRVNIHVALVLESQGEILGTVGVIRENVERLQQPLGESDVKDTRNAKQGTQANVGQSRRLCPWCKKILNEENNQWEPAESYFKEYGREKDLSHCMCQNCAKRLGLFDPDKISENDDMLI